MSGESNPLNATPKSDKDTSAENPPVYTEVLLDEFDTLHDETMGQELAPEAREEVVHRLHSLAEKFENNEMLVAYEEGRVPTFASMQKAVDMADAHLAAGPEDEESIRLRKLLSQRVKEIRRWCSKYEQVVVVFHRRKKHMRTLPSVDAQEAMTRIDTERRFLHENLMGSIRSLDALLAEIDALDALPTPIARMKPRQFLTESFANENPLIFSADCASDAFRDDIRDWALVANLQQKLDAQRAFFEKSSGK
jgi:hypothetical protein